VSLPTPPQVAQEDEDGHKGEGTLGRAADTSALRQSMCSRRLDPKKNFLQHYAEHDPSEGMEQGGDPRDSQLDWGAMGGPRPLQALLLVCFLGHIHPHHPAPSPYI
jgi:hypothetical protein